MTLDWLLSMLIAVSSPQKGIASQFAHPGDRWIGGKSPCLKVGKKYRKPRPSDHIIAHRTLRCGTRVLVVNPRTKKATIAIVGDHGPYGACLDPGFKMGKRCSPGMWVLKRKHSDPGVWRGIADLTPSVAAAIGHRGMGPVVLYVLVNKVSSRKKRPNV